MASTDTTDPTQKLWWAVPAGATVVLLILLLFIQPKKDPLDKGTSYDASPEGFRAAYLLLEELGYPVARSPRLGGESVRWLLYPNKADKEATNIDAWVNAGGVLVLADDKPDWAKQCGIGLEVRRENDDPGAETATGPDLTQIVAGRVRVNWPGEKGTVWARAGGEPLVTVYRRGQGAIYLIHRPEVVTNRCLLEADRQRADNGVFVCRLAEEVLQGGAGRLAFDEYFHGLRDRPGVLELLLKPPLIWVTLQALALLGLLLWHSAPRFGVVKTTPPLRRRSKEEFLDALAELLNRKADYLDAVESVRHAWRHELAEDLGLPPGTPPETLVAEAARHRPIDPATYLRLLSGRDAVGGAHAFVQTLRDIEKARHEWSERRNDR